MTHTEGVCLHVLGNLLEGLSEHRGRGSLEGSTHPLELDACFCEPPSSIRWCWGLVGLWEVKVHSLVRGERRLSGLLVRAGASLWGGWG